MDLGVGVARLVWGGQGVQGGQGDRCGRGVGIGEGFSGVMDWWWMVGFFGLDWMVLFCG